VVARPHRMGATRPVNVKTLIMKVGHCTFNTCFTWKALQAQVVACTLHGRHKTRKREDARHEGKKLKIGDTKSSFSLLSIPAQQRRNRRRWWRAPTAWAP